MMPYHMRACGSNAMVREYAGGSINGILRKTGASAGNSCSNSANGHMSYGPGMATGTDARHPALDLLVFGYACKIFRDDEKARDMDQGKQLIPWMGDVNLKIDRYDVRGALCELSTYEAPPGGYGNRLEYLSAEEQRAEQLCEEERYLFLYNNEEELRMQQEEDLKRLQQETSGGNYSQIDFQYESMSTSSASSVDTASTALTNASTPSDECELPYTLPNNLLVAPAPDIQVPETMKQHAIIEKTARFIATQGAQMEILIKAKQANNAQFDFLSQGGQLQPYYRHLLSAIKQGKYAAAAATEATAQMDKAENSSLPGSGSPKRSQQIITVPTIKYKPSANCAYTQLISKIKGVPLQAVLDDEVASQHSGGTASPTLSSKSEGTSSAASASVGAASAASTSTAEFTPVLLQYNGSTFAHEAEDTASSNSPPKVTLLKNTSALALAQNYSSDSDDDDDDEQVEANNNSNEKKEPSKQAEQPKSIDTAKPPVALPPPPLLTFPMPEESLRHIIDKTATYVIKNGRQFEETLRTKSVERFNFLLPENKFYAYYMYKITGDVDAASKEEKTRKAAAVAAALVSKKGLGGANSNAAAAAAAAANANAEKAPVCFSIRARDENAPLPPAMPQEVSDEDDETKAKANGDQARPGMPDSVQRAIKQVETQLLARTGGFKSTTASSDSNPATGSAASPQKDHRQAEDRVKDKLALIARDKLNGMISREKQLQLERKRKAMAFLNQIKGEGICGAGDASETSTAATKAESEAMAANSDCDSNESVRSIPITYFGPDDDDDDEANDNGIGVQQAPALPPTRKPDHDDDEDDDGDLEKYNLLNDDSTNTYTSKAATPTAALATAAAPTGAVLLSDDDDVQLVSAAAPPPSARRQRKARRRSRSRSHSRSRSPQDVHVSSPSSIDSGRRSRSRSRSSHRQRHKRHKANTSSKHRRRRRSRSHSSTRSSRLKQRSRSRSRSRSGSHTSSRRHRRDKDEGSSRRRNHQRHPSKKSHKRHKRRRRSSGGESVSQ